MTYRYKIEELEFVEGTVIKPSSLTVIVGPNNSGKSRVLKDIEGHIVGRERSPVLVSRLIHTLPKNVNELLDAYPLNIHRNNSDQYFLRSLASDMQSQYELHVGPAWRKNIETAIESAGANLSVQLASWIGPAVVSLFSTESRLQLIKESPTGDSAMTESLLKALYFEGSRAEDAIRPLVSQAFGKDIRLDFSQLTKLLIRIGDDLSDAPVDARDCAGYYKDVEKLDDQGDGIRSFVATVLAIMVGRRPILLLDEPEAFLHPPQAYRLGEVIAEQSTEGRQTFVATHSSEFLRGVLSRGRDVTLVRVDRNGNTADIKILKNEDVIAISNSPLLSSTRMLDGLFYKGAIIVEADADSTFYQRVGRQLTDADNFHFTHAHNKQTVAKAIPPYRALGVKHAAIVDFDAIRVEAEFVALISAFGFETADKDQLKLWRTSVVKFIEKVSPEELLARTLFELEAEIARVKASPEAVGTNLSNLLGNLKRVRESGTAWKEYKEKGRAKLEIQAQEDFDNLAALCASKGLFIVPGGVLEGWLVPFGLLYTSNKQKWIVNALDKLSEVSVDSALEPWAFINSIFRYLGPPDEATEATAASKGEGPLAAS